MEPDPRDVQIQQLQEQIHSLEQRLSHQRPKRFPIAFVLALLLTIGFGVASLFVDSRLWPFLGISFVGALIFGIFKV
jgi:membrane protein YdbS with pleckstrin-like domain